jgi:hypothetical protein
VRAEFTRSGGHGPVGVIEVRLIQAALGYISSANALAFRAQLAPFIEHARQAHRRPAGGCGGDGLGVGAGGRGLGVGEGEAQAAKFGGDVGPSRARRCRCPASCAGCRRPGCRARSTPSVPVITV